MKKLLIHVLHMILTLADNMPGVEGGEDEDNTESKEEQERLRQEALKQAEMERRLKYKKQEGDRESMRHIIRDKGDIRVRYVADPTSLISINFS